MKPSKILQPVAVECPVLRHRGGDAEALVTPVLSPDETEIKNVIACVNARTCEEVRASVQSKEGEDFMRVLERRKIKLPEDNDAVICDARGSLSDMGDFAKICPFGNKVMRNGRVDTKDMFSS